MQKTTLIIACIACCFSLQAQQQKVTPHFKSINTIGFLNGQNGSNFTLQTINGIALNKYFAGIGVAIDNYGYRSVPVFVDVRKQFGNKAFKPFVYLDGGLNIPVRTNALPEKWSNGNDAYQLKNTFYDEAGLGFTKPISQHANFVLAIGFSYKHFSYLQQTQGFNIWVDSRSPVMQYDYYYRRVAVKMGLGF